ncbi:hypothetical protein GOA63_22230 [Sinorhizobium meliloti]|nr:hypothetical protein [Sinorhizobium meliloti]MDX0189909.1 hypothetical protein [Sinorhizobium meliloti]MQV09909.1 hypothetical protein [Sinorhizobium meliloti]MQV61069.1 hypothetical protein [Sinorhizobium meliloti]
MVQSISALLRVAEMLTPFVSVVWHIHIAFQQKLIHVKLPLPSKSESPSIEGNQGTIPPFPPRFASGGLPPCLPPC